MDKLLECGGKNCNDCYHREACSEMLRAQGFTLPENYSGSAERCGTFVPAVDVVPRSEVEKIFEEIKMCSEVALMNGHIETPILCIGFGVFAELKKKYKVK